MNSEIKTARASAICSTLGGELISYKLDGNEYVWEGIPEYWASHTPVLFPTVGSTIDSSVKFEGVAYPLAKHGFARKREFVLVESGADTLTYELRDDEETKKLCPIASASRLHTRLQTRASQPNLRLPTPITSQSGSASAVIPASAAR